ncbi:hypothetical protein NW765_017571 [Fusarium oxysporum]|nr:hypothetical protein NW765_017571 [Fusarium oxysporum]
MSISYQWMWLRGADTSIPAARRDLRFLPHVPTIIIYPAYRTQRKPRLVCWRAWGRRREELIDQDLFVALYQGSLTERF